MEFTMGDLMELAIEHDVMIQIDLDFTSGAKVITFQLYGERTVTRRVRYKILTNLPPESKIQVSEFPPYRYLTRKLEIWWRDTKYNFRRKYIDKKRA